MSSELTPVQEFYKGKTVFITGASGFMGKVLLEKLLYSCSELDQAIILMRPKRDKTPEKRLEEMFKLPLFQRINDEKPHVLKKVTLVQGDVTKDELGLSDSELKLLSEKVNIVYHMAATLKLEGNLTDAINMNLTGTQRTLNIAKKMKNLIVFIHLSTAFCNCDQEVMYEKVYEFHHKPEDLMRLAEWMDVKELDKITPELIKPHPNTYTYSKRLAEILVRDQYPEMPVIITRPSIVSPAAYEPLPGWVDNLNGPTGLMVGAGKGVIRSILIEEDYKAELIPVDYAINGLITMAYEFGVAKVKPETVPVYNITNAEHRKTPWGEINDKTKQIAFEYPLNPGLWSPEPTTTSNRFYHNFNVLMFQWLPAYFIDFLLLIFGQKRFMIRVQNKIAVGMDVLEFFTMNKWQFKSDHYASLYDNLTDRDRKNFIMDMDKPETDTVYMINCAKGTRKFLLKESLDDYPKVRIQVKAMRILDRIVKAIFLFYAAKWLLNIIGFWDIIDPFLRLQETFETANL